jgi:hypothetical protein
VRFTAILVFFLGCTVSSVSASFKESIKSMFMAVASHAAVDTAIGNYVDYEHDRICGIMSSYKHLGFATVRPMLEGGACYGLARMLKVDKAGEQAAALWGSAALATLWTTGHALRVATSNSPEQVEEPVGFTQIFSNPKGFLKSWLWPSKSARGRMFETGIASVGSLASLAILGAVVANSGLSAQNILTEVQI